jgi:hypothetical protein
MGITSSVILALMLGILLSLGLKIMEVFEEQQPRNLPGIVQL